MIRRMDHSRRAFYVVQFLELPFEGIDDYVCVPNPWVKVRKATKNKSVVAYPQDEDPFVTRDRVKNEERCNDAWRYYMASIKYETDSFEDAEYWIATSNYNALSIEGELKTTEPEFWLNKKLRIANRNHSSKLNDNPRKPLPRMSIKRPLLPEPNKQLHGKQMKLDDAAQSSSAVVTDANAEPGSSRQEQSIIAQDNQPMESAQKETTASDSNGTSKSSQRKDKNLQESSSTIMEQSSVTTQNQSQGGAQIQKMRSGNSRKSTSLLRSMAISSKKINDVPRINLKRSSNVNTVDPPNIVQSFTNVASASQSGLSSPIKHPRYVRQLDGQRSLPNQQQSPTQSYQNQHIPTNQNNYEQDLLRKSAKRALSIEGDLKTTDIEPEFSLNKQLRIANRNHSSKLNDNPRKPLPRMSIKRPLLPEPNKQLNGKQMKLDDAVQSSCAVVTDANAEPGSSRQEQSIIAQDNQPMESAQKETTASDSNGTSKSSQRKDENLQESSSTIIEQSSVTTQNQSQGGAQIQKMRSGNSRKSTSLLRSMAISSQEINDVPRINLKSSSNVNTVDPRNIVQSFTNVASASQSGLSSPIKQPRYVRQLDGQRSLPDQQQSPTQSYQNQHIPTNQNNFEQDLLRKSAEHNNYEHRPNSRTIRMSTPSIGQNSIIPSSPLYQTSELPQQRQSHPSQQDSIRQPQKPKIRISISTKPKNNQQTPTLQVTKETLSPILTKVLNSVRQALSATDNQYLQNEQQFQGNHSERALVNENHLSEIDNTLETDEWMKEETPSAHHGANSDSDTVIDHEVTSDHEMSADEAPIEITNNFYGHEITSGSSSADRPIAAQNSTNHQTHSRVVLMQQMLDNFDTLFIQMGSTYRDTTDMYNTLRSLMLDTAQTYKKLIEEVSQFHEESTQYSTTQYTSTQDQHSHDDANRTPKTKHNSWRLVLPPEYDPRDTKWTLKYRTYLPGLVELMPQSGVYVSYGDLKYSQQVSKDCKSLAKRLLSEIFNRNALSVCLSMTERAQTPDNIGYNIRPELDVNACTVLLNFVIEHGLQRGWNTDLQPILSTLHSKIKEIRFKYGVVVQC
ncbi:unnamed protein product [Euphydryas editha]|uniref:BEN domain-containing protein n=1 Tax=Euphydryas editha TaxID=104508 RepID=A0AAU9UF78_EUPED|nr:unnamed protein product [Euphydryas editha]